MAQMVAQWQELKEFGIMVARLVDKYPDRFSHVDPNEVIAYACINKDRTETKAKVYDMTAEKEPEAFTNTKRYFVKFFLSDWEGRDETSKLWLVFSALSRIDPETPGKIGPLDYRDQCIMVRTLGPDWVDKGNLPNLLAANINFQD